MNLIVILGPTTSGKTKTSLELAKKLNNSWVVNCDSRQVYKNLNISTAKVPGKWENRNNLEAFWYDDVPHFLIDYIDPYADFEYNLHRYIKDFNTLFKDQKPKNVILVGGTGLYAKAIYTQLQIQNIKDNFIGEYNEYKTQLQEFSKLKLQSIYKNIETESHKLNDSDYQNPRRLVTYILNKKVLEQNWSLSTSYPQFKNIYLFAKKIDLNSFQQEMEKSIKERWDNGLLDEMQQLEALGEDKFISLGLEFRQYWHYKQGQLSQDELFQKLVTENWRYAKRQLTWLKKEPVTWKTHEEILNIFN